MYSTDPWAIQSYRDKTNEGASLNLNPKRRFCQCCRKPKASSGGRIKRGTSRHNPTQFTCVDCLQKEQ